VIDGFIRCCCCVNGSVAVSSHLACSDVNPQQQPLCVSWATAPSSYIIAGLSSSSSTSSLSATAADNIRRYDAARASQYAAAARPTCLPVSAVQSVVMPAAAPAAAAADAVRSKSIFAADKAVYQPVSIPLTHKPAVFARPTINNPTEMYRGSAGYGAPTAVRHAAAVDGPMSQCHVDPSLGGSCVACEYIRVNTWQRYEPYTTRHYDKSNSNKSYRVCYY